MQFGKCNLILKPSSIFFQCSGVGTGKTSSFNTSQIACHVSTTTSCIVDLPVRNLAFKPVKESPDDRKL